MYLKGKIISFSPHRRRGLIVVHVKGEEGLVYQHLQFDFKHYDASIVTHLYKDQSVDVTLKNIKRGVYKIEKITYDIGKNLYKRTQPDRPSPDQRRSSRDGWERRPDKRTNYGDKRYSNRSDESNRSQRYRNQNKGEDNRNSQNRSFRKPSQKSNKPIYRNENRNRQRGDNRDSTGRKDSQNRYNRGPKPEGSIQRKFDQSSRNRNQSGKRNQPHRDGKKRNDQQLKRKSRESRKPQRGFSRGRFRERLRYLAIFLHYRRIKIQKSNRLTQLQRMRKLNYQRKLRISS